MSAATTAPVSPRSRAVWVDGAHVHALTPAERAPARGKLGMVLQMADVLDSLTVEENAENVDMNMTASEKPSLTSTDRLSRGGRS